MNTNQQFEEAVSACRRVFAAKLGDYGPSWRMMRPQSVTDQIFIKARRIRSLEIKRVSAVGEGILPEFMAIVNYSIIGVIQLENGFADSYDITAAEALALYDNVAARALELMKAKNHDYDEAWRMMRVPSYTDFILTKLERIKEIEDNDGRVAVSEGIESNYLDILVYAVFGVIKLTE
jgi:hypothetical protein